MSFFADLLGNASLAGGQMLEDDRNIREKEALVNRQAQLETERSIATEKRKMEMQEQQRQALQQRTQDQMDQAERGGQAIGEARDMGALDKARAMVPNEGQYAGKKITLGDVETIRANMSPEDAQKYYGIKPETTQSVLGDQLTAARAGGLHDAAGSLKTAYDETVKALQAQFKEKTETRRLDQADARLSETERKTDLQHNASMARIDASEKRTTAGGDKMDKLTTQLDKIRQIKAQMTSDVGPKKAATSPRYQQLEKDEDEILASLRDERRGKQAADPAKPAPGAKPAPAAAIPSTWKQVGTSGGKPVYEDSVTKKRYQ